MVRFKSKGTQLILTLSFMVVSFVSGALTSILLIQARSDSLIKDDFSGALSNWYAGGDEGGVIVQDISFYVSPNASMKILTPIGNGKEYYAERGTSLPFNKKIGTTFWWQINGNAKTFEVKVSWHYVESQMTERYVASLVYFVTEMGWKYLGADGYYHGVPDGTQVIPVADTAVWIRSRLVVDFNTREYVEFSCGDRTFSLRELQLPSLDSFGGERIDWRFSIINSNNSYSAMANVDDLLVTEE